MLWNTSCIPSWHGHICHRSFSPVSVFGYIIKCEHVKADPEKIGAVVEWPTSTLRKQLQRFGDFTNFSFIISAGVQHNWSVTERASLPKLQSLYTSLQFVVKVDMSNTGMGAVLSQRFGLDIKLHPCVYFFSISCLPKSAIIALVTRNCLWSRWPWNGGMG